jgi:phage terminase large subunit-like protein
MARSGAEGIRGADHLATPAHLAIEDTGGKWRQARHLSVLNRALMTAWAEPSGRLVCNMPFQHGKSWLCSHYFPAWVLLLWPETRIILAAHSDRYAMTFGMKVRDVLARFGAPFGVELRRDSQAKDEWVIKGHGGGLVCRGGHGAIVGRPADLLLIDDLVRDAEEALSPVVLEKHWDWYCTAAFSRLGPTAPVVIVGTRWSRSDLFGRIRDEARQTGEKWTVLSFKAIATEGDPLGRSPGEALWPERVPLKRLEMIRKQRGRWFSACWQQEPEDEYGQYFRPHGWPTYTTVNEQVWSVPEKGGVRRVVDRGEATVFSAVDWATSEGKKADYTAVGTFAVLPEGRMLVLDAVTERVPVEGCVPLLAACCRRWRPQYVVAESGGFQGALLLECQRNYDVPEVRPVKPGGKTKLQRAVDAIILGENGKVLLPAEGPEWLDGYRSQLAAFNGLGEGHDDLVDVTAYAAVQAGRIRGLPANPDCGGPCVLTPGREGGFWF